MNPWNASERSNAPSSYLGSRCAKVYRFRHETWFVWYSRRVGSSHSQRCSPAIASIVLALGMSGSRSALAAEEQNASAPRPVERTYPHPTLLWGVTQLIPSPTWFIGPNVQFALGWQVTPVLLSFATHRDISPWRFLAADPWARHGGSVELFAAPYVFFVDPRVSAKFGARAYMPIEGRGEQLSFATGAAAFVTRDGTFLAIDAGFYTAGGFVGLEGTWILGNAPQVFALSIRLRSM